MKKTGKLLILSALVLLALCLFLILNSHLVHALEISPTTYNQIGEKIPSSPEDLGETGKAYLKQEWAKILEKSKIGRVLLAISSILTLFDFYWKPVLGISYSLSWEFIFGIAILAILTNIFRGAMYIFFDKKGLSLAAGFVIASLVGTAGVINKALNLLTFAIKNVWIAWISLILAVLIIVAIGHFTGGLKTWIEKEKDKAEKEKTKNAEKVIQRHGKIAEKELKSYE